MNDLFDKEFFRFVIGFILIILASFSIMIFSGIYQSSVNATAGSVEGQ